MIMKEQTSHYTLERPSTFNIRLIMAEDKRFENYSQKKSNIVSDRNLSRPVRCMTGIKT